MNNIYWVLVGIMVIMVSTVAILNIGMSGQNPGTFVSVVYGQAPSSLEELESQLAQENTLESRMASYKAALIDYIESYNIAVNEDLYETTIDALEKIVQAHMDTSSQLDMTK
jgi:guanylate kinase